MTLYDVTLTLSASLPVWPGDPAFRLERFAKVERGDAVNLSAVRMSVHFGTHIDAPLHVLAGGDSVADLSLDLLVGAAWVAHLPETARAVTPDILEVAAIPSGTTRLLLRTGNSLRWGAQPTTFVEDYPGLTGEAAEWVVRRGIRLLGIDCLSVDLFGAEGLPAHRALLENGVPVIEGLDLHQVPEGPCTLLCLPIKLAGSDGAPARVVLISKD